MHLIDITSHLDQLLLSLTLDIEEELKNHIEQAILHKIRQFKLVDQNKNPKFVIVLVNELFNEVQFFKETGLHVLNSVLKKHNLSVKNDLVCIFNLTIPDIGVKTLNINYFAYLTYYVHTFQDNKFNTKWNSNSNKALMLLGKMNKDHRYRTCEIMVDNNWLIEENIDWSMELQYDGKLTPYKRMLDVDLTACHVPVPGVPWELTIHYTGYPYAESLYENTLYSIILESASGNLKTFQAQPSTTEKTYRAMINRHPFILICSANTHKLLNDQGFKTFEAYYECPLDVFETTDVHSDTYTDGLMKTLENFNKNLLNNIDEVQEAVTHNFNKVMQYGKFIQNELEQHVVINDDHNMDLMSLPIYLDSSIRYKNLTNNTQEIE